MTLILRAVTLTLLVGWFGYWLYALGRKHGARDRRQTARHAQPKRKVVESSVVPDDKRSTES